MAYRHDPYDRRWSSEDYPSRRDSYGRDVDRDQDRSFRDRDRDRDRRSMAQPPTGPRIDASAKKLRTDQPPSRAIPSEADSLRASSKQAATDRAGQAPESPRPDSKSTIDGLTVAFRKYGDLLTERAQMKQDERALDRIYQQRELEFKMSQPRHAEYPSIPDLHKRFSNGEAKQREVVKKYLEQNNELCQRTTNSIVTQLLQSVSSSSTKDAAAKDPQDNTTQVAAAAAAASALYEAKATAMQKQLSEFTELVNSVATKQAELEGGLKAEKAARRIDLQEALRQHAASLEITSLKEENTQLRSENDSNKSSIVELIRRVDDLSSRVTEQDDELRKLRTTSSEQQTALREMAGKIGHHEHILSEFDPVNLNKAADFFAFDKPAMESNLERHESRLKEMAESIKVVEVSVQDAAQKAGKNSEVFVTKAMGILGKKLDEAKKAHDAHDERIKKLESDVSEKLTAAQNEAPPRVVAEEQPKPLKAEVQKSIQDTMVKVEKVEERVDSLDLMVATLSGRFDNLTTKELFDHIVGHMQALYPNPTQHRQDLDKVLSKYQLLKQESDNLASQMQEVHQLLMAVARSKGASQDDHGPVTLASIPAPNEQMQAKRRRLDKGNMVFLPNGGV